MSELRFNQSDFTAGQLDPKVFARDDYAGYYRGAKDLTNMLVLPQGGITRRWGTRYVSTLTTTNPTNTQLVTFVYEDSATYLLCFYDSSLDIYLENILLMTMSVPYMPEDVQNIRYTQIQNRMVFVNENFQPYQLIRSPDGPNPITGFSADTLTIANPLTIGWIVPVQFSTTGSLPTTSPQIYRNRTYFAKVITTNTVKLYSTSQDAYDDTNAYTITALGASSALLVQNSWTFSAINFSFLPSYDFDDGYTTITFTPSATYGTITLTASSAIFTPEHVGGLFYGNGGSLRITGYTSDVIVSGNVILDFPPIPGGSTPEPIIGSEAFLGQPAWSNTLGWPRTATYFQGRLWLGGSRSISNGVWGSVINSPYDFDDSDPTLADTGISYYPSSGSQSYVLSLTSASTLLIHTNTGTFSTPIGNETPLTPTNFVINEQTKDGVSSVQPVFIDNQVVYIDRSGKNAKNLIYDIIQGRYVLNNISVASSFAIKNPVDMDSFNEPSETNASFVLFVNDDGTLGIFNTLIEQQIAAWSMATTLMSDETEAYYRHVVAAMNQCWFIVERLVDGQNVLMIEALDFSVKTDCSKTYSNWGSATLTGLSYLEGETLQIVADGSVLQPQEVIGGEIVLSEAYDDIQVGLQYVANFTPMPIGSLPGTPANLYKPMMIREMYVYFYQSLGMTFNGFTIPTTQIQNYSFNEPMVPATGRYEIPPMLGWDNQSAEINIRQSLPLPMTILGVGYILEIPT